MKLIFTNEQDCDASLAAVNDAYGCPYDDGSYRMDNWAIKSASLTGNAWGFDKPELRLGVSQETLDACIINGTEIEAYPDGWHPAEEV